MEPRREEQPQAPQSAETKPKRFRVVRLEDRIAPGKGNATRGGLTCPTGDTCNCLDNTITCAPDCW